MKKIVGFVAAWLSLGPAMAQTPTTYQLTDSALSIHQIHSFTCLTSQLCQVIVPIDFTGSPFGVSGNPFFVAPGAGATFPVSGSVAITGTLPAFAATPTFNCGTGCASGGGVVTNAGAFAVQLTGSANNLNNIAGTITLPTGAATAANQATNAATTVHTCATSGFSELGCLGQLDDDIKAGTGTLAATLPTQALLTGMKDGITGLLSPVIGDAATGQWVNLTVVGGTSAAGLIVAPSTAPVTATDPAMVTVTRPDQLTAASTATGTTQPSFPTNESPNSQLSVTTGTTADAAYTGSGSATLDAILKGIYAVANGPVGSGVQATAPRITIATDSPGLIQDPCASGTRASAPISVTSATTTALVAVSGSTTVYVCGFAMTIAPSATAADSAAFEYGTGTACATGPTLLTGTFGSGDLTTAAPPTSVSYGGGLNTIFKSPASSGVCLLTAGTTVNVQGVLTYVQQ